MEFIQVQNFKNAFAHMINSTARRNRTDSGKLEDTTSVLDVPSTTGKTYRKGIGTIW
jgi:hypothetical protein